MSTRILNAQGILSSEVPTGNLLWVDQVNGVDGLAVRGRMTIPFRTLTAAKGAAKSGDKIMVLPGNYDERNLLKNGVNWHFLNGAVVQYSGTADGGIFDTSSTGANQAVNSAITGFGIFAVGQPSLNAKGHVIQSAATSDHLFIQARSMSSYDTAIKIASSSSTVEVSVLEGLSCSLDAISVVGASTSSIIRAHSIISSGAALYVGAGSIDAFAHRITAGADGAIVIAGGTGAVTVRAFEMLSSTDHAVKYTASSTFPKLTVIGSRIVTAGVSKRAVDFSSNNSSVSKKVRLASCVLIATDTVSIKSAYNGTVVPIHCECVANKAQDATVNFGSPATGDFRVSTDID